MFGPDSLTFLLSVLFLHVIIDGTLINIFLAEWDLRCVNP